MVAVPLMARSGVYRSVHDLIGAANADGLDWKAIVGTRSSASGKRADTAGVREVAFDYRGTAGLKEIERLLSTAPEARRADVIISMITQSDVAMSKSSLRTGRKWIAWVRGKPWPARGEQNLARRLLLQQVETRALRKADDVWATTPVLASQFKAARSAFIVPAGIAPVERLQRDAEPAGPLVWAGRVDVDKRPELFADIVLKTGHRGRALGDGPLLEELRERGVPKLSWDGWRDAEDLWGDASIYIGTSAREAFGRSAVEAAASGLPVILSSEYGAAPLLFTSERLAEICVVSSADPGDWAAKVRKLLDDPLLRAEVADHVHANAANLTITASLHAASRRAAAVVSGQLVGSEGSGKA